MGLPSFVCPASATRFVAVFDCPGLDQGDGATRRRARTRLRWACGLAAGPAVGRRQAACIPRPEPHSATRCLTIRHSKTA